MPDQGDPQILWPKNTAATAGVAALAQDASSPLFPDVADLHLEAQLPDGRRVCAVTNFSVLTPLRTNASNP